MLTGTLMRLLAAMLLAALCFAALSCGGGGEDLLDPGGQITTPSGEVLPLVIEGGTQYPGQPPEPTDPGQIPATPIIDEPIGDYGPNVIPIPLDSNGAGRALIANFSPGQKAAFVVVNVNPAFLDAHDIGDSGFPVLPESSYSIVADLVSKGVSGMQMPDARSNQPTPAQPIYQGFSGGYSGIDDGPGLSNPAILAEREARGWGKVPYAAQTGIKTTSSIQKGEIRTFTNVPPRTGPPVILPGDDPDQDLSELFWPSNYDSQDGRLVTIGAHCLVFLSTEINNGIPDTIQFTEARLNRLAREFDTVIFPNSQNAFGPVHNYLEASVWKNLDRSIQLTGDDFENEELQIELPGLVDANIHEEGKIIIFFSNADAGGFYAWRRPNRSDPDNPTAVAVGSTLYIGGDNFPANDNGWEAVYSVIAHEFQHKLFHDNGLPSRSTSYGWFNEGMSMLAFHINGYTVNSGNIIDWAIDGQLTDYLTSINASAVPMDANRYFSNQTQYGNGFLFFLYLYEHYDPGVGRRIYNAAREGVTDYINLIEIGAQTSTYPPGADGIVGTQDDPGPDGVVGTADDGEPVRTRDSFENIYVKFALANFIDGIYSDNGEFAGSDTDVFDPRFIYNTIDLKGTVNLSDGIIVLPGVRRSIFPVTGTYPVQDIHRLVIPWASDYLIFGNGDGETDLEVKVYADPNFRMFMLPASFGAEDHPTNTNPNKLYITPGVVIN